MAKVALGAVVSEVRGEVGNEVFVRGRRGTVLRDRPNYSFPVTPAQKRSNLQFQRVVQVYNALSREQVRAWNAYASTLARHDSVTGKSFTPTGQNVFVGLARKFVQIDPTGDIPLTPPPSPFAGDTVRVTAAVAGGVIVFTASGPNHAPAQTELLLQKLKSARRAPTDRYISQTFVSFAAGSLSHGIAVPPGLYVPAYRMVNAATGQMTALQPLPEVEVV